MSNGNDTCRSKEVPGKYNEDNCPCFIGLLNSKELLVSRRIVSDLRGEVQLPFYYEEPKLVLLLFVKLLPRRASRLKAIKYKALQWSLVVVLSISIRSRWATKTDLDIVGSRA